MLELLKKQAAHHIQAAHHWFIFSVMEKKIHASWADRNIESEVDWTGPIIRVQTVFDGTSENIVSNKIKKLKLPIEKHPNPCWIAWF